jgi:putative aminopeptidase FrvX
VPRAEFVVMANKKTYLSKAFDDRIGVAMTVSVLQELQNTTHPNTLFGVATVMEEVGLRGATTSVRAINPDIAIVLEADIAGDVPGIKPEESAIKLGKGPSLLIYDARMIPNLILRDMVINTAKENELPLQVSYVEGGATDGGAIHLHDLGVPTVVIGIPARHIHSHSAIIHQDDYHVAVKLVIALLKKLDGATVLSLTA